MAYYNTHNAGEVQFNLGLTQLQKIGSLMNASINGYTNQDLSRWFKNVKALKLIIISRLSKEERIKLGDLEKIITHLFGMLKPTGLQYSESNERHNSSVIFTMNPLIEQYHTLMMELLETKGFLVPTKRDRTNMFEDFEEDFA